MISPRHREALEEALAHFGLSESEDIGYSVMVLAAKLKEFEERLERLEERMSGTSGSVVTT